MATATRENRYILTAEDRTAMAFASLQRNFNNMQRMLGILSRITAGAFSVQGLIAFATKVAEAERSVNRLTAVINAQGHAGGFTRDQLERMNDQLARTSQFDDEAIRSAQAELLKYGNIYESVFERALRASADLAAFQGTDLASATETVARALQNPTASLRGFEQQLGKLDPAQKKVIENLVEQNKVIEAQHALLDILQGKIGGAADQMNTGWSKAIGDVKKNWDDLLEALGRTPAVQGPVETVLDGIADKLRKIKETVESGNWIALVMTLTGVRDWFELIFGPTAPRQSGPSVEGRIRGTESMKPVITPEPGKDKKVKEDLSRFDKGLTDFQKKYQDYLASLRDLRAVRAEELAREEEILALKIENENFGRELAEEERRRRREALELAREYVTGVERERDMLSFSNEERKRFLDLVYLESIGLKRGTDEWNRMAFALDNVRTQQQQVNAMWSVGASRALADYVDEVNNLNDSTYRYVTGALRSLEDALVDTFRTGKFEARQFFEYILAEALRLRLQRSIIAPLAEFLGGSALFGGIGALIGGGPSPSGGSITVDGLAEGGPVSAYRPYLVGERGPELFVPRTGGTIVPNGAGGVTIVQHINVDSRSDQASIVTAMLHAKEAAKAEIRNEFYRGGRVAAAAGTR